jgi:plasmid stabilization system protein ParE
MKVRYTRPALSRLGELVAALYEQNPFAVQRLAKQLACSIRRIEAFPLSGATET